MFVNNYVEFQDGDSTVFDQGHCETGRFDGTGPMFCPSVSPVGRKWQPAAVSLPGEAHGQGSLVGYSSRVCKESDPTDGLTLSLSPAATPAPREGRTEAAERRAVSRAGAEPVGAGTGGN